VFPVKFHELQSGVDHLLLRLYLKDCVAPDNLSGVCERAIDHCDFSLRKPDAVEEERAKRRGQRAKGKEESGKWKGRAE